MHKHTEAGGKRGIGSFLSVQDIFTFDLEWPADTAQLWYRAAHRVLWPALGALLCAHDQPPAHQEMGVTWQSPAAIGQQELLKVVTSSFL